MTDRTISAAPLRSRRIWLPSAQPSVEGATTAASFGPWGAISVSLWFGLAVGLGELALAFLLKPLTDPSPGLFRMSRHIFLVIPAFNLLMFGLVGLAQAVILHFRSTRGGRGILVPHHALALLTLLLCFHRIHTVVCLVVACGLGYRLTRHVEGRLPALLKFYRWSTPVLGAGALALAWFSIVIHARSDGASLPPVPEQPLAAGGGPGALNVLLVVLDTVRADHLSLYGYARETTPNLSKLARRGIVFEQARCTAPWTLPSHASMMTGRWPHELSVNIDHPLDATYPTLAQFLGSNGYATAGFVGNISYCGAETGLDRGFAHYEDHDLSPASLLWLTAVGRMVLCPIFAPQDARAGGHTVVHLRKDAARIRGDLMHWLDRQGNRPFFAFVNLYDAHNPYIPPEGFDRHFGIWPDSPEDYEILDRWFIVDKSKLSSRDLRLGADAYDDCLAYLDDQIGRLVEDLDRRGRLANTLVIVTADHGEHLGEHGLYGHASSLYDQETHVPLLILSPGEKHPGRVLPQSVSLRDLPATVADVLDLNSLSPFPGRSIVRESSEQASSPAPMLIEINGPVHTPPNQTRSPVFRGPMQALVEGQRVYIHNGDGREELFDIKADPAQVHDLAPRSESRPDLEQFRVELERILRHNDLPPVQRSEKH
jgi:arylsulfatase A-like enzyme